MRRVTLKDVARAAGVTTATVSYVINDTPGQTITPETRERVLKAVAELRYIPNVHARTLRKRSSPCVGVVIRKNLAVPRFSQVVYGIQTRLVSLGRSTLLLSGVTDKVYGVSDYVLACLAGQVEGVIFIGEDNQGPSAESARALAEAKAPLVVYDCQRESDAYSTIDLDYRGGARLLASHVLGRGPARVLYVRPSTDTPQERLRELGVRDVCDAAGIPLEVGEMPVTLDNIDVWDAHYSIGDTADALELMERFMAEVEALTTRLSRRDAVISSWAGWTHYFRKLAPELALVTGELANNGENRLAADFYTALPNFEAGVACADELCSLVGGSGPSARTLKLTDCVEASLG